LIEDADHGVATLAVRRQTGRLGSVLVAVEGKRLELAVTRELVSIVVLSMVRDE
jgi:hypothetical protein